jgi:hypothetical protein
MHGPLAGHAHAAYNAPRAAAPRGGAMTRLLPAIALAPGLAGVKEAGLKID